jgi:hypothetical protein
MHLNREYVFRFNCCNSEPPLDHVFRLPRINARAVEELKPLGVESIRDIPEDFLLNDMQRRACASVKTSQLWRSTDAQRVDKGSRLVMKSKQGFVKFDGRSTAGCEFRNCCLSHVFSLLRDFELHRFRANVPWHDRLFRLLALHLLRGFCRP